MNSNSLILALLYCGAFGALFVGLEVIVRKLHIWPDVTRRFAHVAAGLFSLLMWYTFSPVIFLICCIVFFVGIGFSYRKRLLSSVHNVRRKTYGELWLPVGVFVTFMLTAGRPEVFVPAILIMTLADAAAGIVGDLRQKQRPSKLGSVVFFVVAVAILTAFTTFPLAVAVAFVAMVVEKISPHGSDNATVPLTVALLL